MVIWHQTWSQSLPILYIAWPMLYISAPWSYTACRCRIFILEEPPPLLPLKSKCNGTWMVIWHQTWSQSLSILDIVWLILNISAPWSYTACRCRFFILEEPPPLLPLSEVKVKWDLDGHLTPDLIIVPLHTIYSVADALYQCMCLITSLHDDSVFAYIQHSYHWSEFWLDHAVFLYS